MENGAILITMESFTLINHKRSGVYEFKGKITEMAI